jgi:hypothetical protein
MCRYVCQRGEPADDGLSLGDELNDPHVYIAERGKERLDPPTSCCGKPGCVHVVQNAEVGAVHHLVDEPPHDPLGAGILTRPESALRAASVAPIRCR